MSANDFVKTWREVLDVIKISVSKPNFSTWFSQTFISSTKKVNRERQLVEIGCPSSFVADTIDKKYFGLVQDAINQITGLKNDLLFVVKQKPGQQYNNEPLFGGVGKKNNFDEEVLKKARIRPSFTFDNFAVSGTNQMAHAAAEAVSQNLGRAYNPLFLWGGVGVGKTHLMLAVGNRALRENPELPALYCMGDEFTTEIVQAIRNKTTNAFKDRYRKLKLLLVDDIQFIAGKDAVQEEFFHTFNILQREGGQIILTSDKPPTEIARLEPRLKSRFEAGLIVDIAPPDFELRTAITLIKAKERGTEISMEVAQSIAANVDGPRKIEGFITHMLTYSSLKHQAITQELVISLLGRGNGDATTKKPIPPQDLIEAVASYYSLGKRRLLGESRMQVVALPRQILMYLLRTELNLPLKEVGRVVGGRDHTTVMHAVEKISRNLSTNNKLLDDILGIKKTVWE